MEEYQIQYEVVFTT